MWAAADSVQREDISTRRSQRTESCALNVHLDICSLDGPYAGGTRGYEIGEGNDEGEKASNSGEEAERVLRPDQRAIHDGRVEGAQSSPRGSCFW